MRKNLQNVARIALIALLALTARISYGQVVFTSIPDSIAVVNELYTYQVTVAASPNAPTYSLQTAPEGMTISSSTGLVSWTPPNMTSGGQVVIKAHNNAGDYFQTYFVFITDAVVCDTNMISYWPMDSKAGSSIPEVIHGYNGLWEGQPGPEPTISDDGMVGKSVSFTPNINDDWGYNVADQNQYEFKGITQFSVSFWFKNQPTNINPPIHFEAFIGRYDGAAANNAGWYVDWNPYTEHVEFYMSDHSTTDTLLENPVLIAGDDYEWHHVVATFYNGPDLQQKAYMHLFVDGVSSELLYDFWTDNFDGTEDLTLGYFFWAPVPYSGLLDEVAVWKKELLQGDVNNLYNNGLDHQAMCHEGDVAPIISSQPVTEATQDIAYNYQFTFRAMQGESVTMSAPVLPSWLSFNANTGVLSGTPTNSNVGDHDVTLRITSGTITIDQTFTIAVANVNDPPVISTTPPTTGNVSELYTYIIAATDVDANTTLTFSAPVLPSWLTFDPSSKLLAGVPAQADKGANDVTLAVSDGTVTVEQPFVIQVSGPSGINDKTGSLARVYPIPAKEYVMFEFPEKLDKADLQIFNTTGNLMKKVDISNSNTYKLDVSDLKPNNYLYRINSSKGQQTGALIIK
jgi:hypothetical protein